MTSSASCAIRSSGFASDSGVLVEGEGSPHPRGYGNAVRVLGEYVRERKVISLEEAVRKMTSLPAQHFQFARRGRLEAGHAADVVIFDPSTVRDAATFERPHAFAAGVPFVVVNGVAVVRDGQHTGAKPGRVLRHAERRSVSSLTPGSLAKRLASDSNTSDLKRRAYSSRST